MLRGLWVALVVAVLAWSVPAVAQAAPQRYIVVLHDDAGDPGDVAADHGRRYEARAEHVYRHALRGYSAVVPSERIAALRADRRVRYVEEDGTMTAVAQTLPWGIDKVDADLSSTLAGNGSGTVGTVNAYVIDTGVDKAHPDLTVVGHVNFAGGPNKDCQGHGTHVAGTMAARDNASDVVGVAPGAPLTGVKVLSCSGSGSTSGVIRGVDWVTANAKKPAVANMSLGGSLSQALDDADACTSSPARAGGGTANGVMTVAATDPLDLETSWSNFGSCVDIWAPGASVLSTRNGGGTTTMSGTSMAAPHGAGGGALYLSSRPAASPSTVEGALTGAATVTPNVSKDGRAITRLYVGGF